MAFAPYMGQGINIQINADTSGFTSRLRNAHKSVTDFKKILAGTTAALGALAVKGFKDAVDQAREFEEAMIGVEKVTTPETARELNGALKDMANEIPLAHKELAQIAEQAGRLGVEGTDNIKNFTEIASKMATATDMSVEEAGDSFARLTTLLDISIDNVENLGSAINDMANNMATSASEITEATMRSSSSLKQLGASEEEILALNASMNEVSVSSRKAGTAMRSIASELMSPKKVEKLAESFDMTVGEFKSMRDEDPTDLIRMLSKTMGDGGDQAEQLRDILGRTAVEGLGKLATNLDSVDEGMERASTQFENGTALQEEFETASRALNNQLDLIRNRINTVYITVGERFLPVLNDMAVDFQGLIPTASAVENHLDKVETMFQENSDTINAMKNILSELAGIIKGVVVSTFTMLSDKAEKVSEIVSDGLARIDGGLSDNQAGFERFANIVESVINFVVEYVVDFWILQMEIAFEKWITIINTVNALLEGDFQGAVESVFTGMENIVDSSMGFVIGRLEGFEDFLEDTFGVQIDLVGTLRTTYEDTKEVIAGVIKNLQDNFEDRFGDMEDTTGDLVSAIVDFGSEVGDIFASVAGVIDENSEEILDILDTIVMFVADKLITQFEISLDIITGVFEALTELLQGDVDGALEALESTVDSVTKKVKRYFDRNIKRVNRLLENDLIGSVVDTVEAIQDWFGDTKLGRAVSTAQEYFEALTGSAKSMWNKLVGNSYIPDMVKDIDYWFGDSELGSATDKAQQLFNETVDRIGNLLQDNLSDDVKSTVEDVQTWFSDSKLGQATSQAKSFFGDVADGAKGMMIDVVGNSYVPDMVEGIDQSLTGDLPPVMNTASQEFDIFSDNVEEDTSLVDNYMSSMESNIEDIIGDITQVHLPDLADTGSEQVSILRTELDDLSEETLTQLQGKLGEIQKKNKVWGDSFDAVSASQREVQRTINELISQGLDPQSTAIQDLKTYYDELGKAQSDYKDDTEELLTTMDNLFSKIGNSEDSLKTLQNEFENFLTDTLTEDISEGKTLMDSISDMMSDFGSEMDNIMSTLSESAGSGGLGNMASAGLVHGGQAMLDEDKSTGSKAMTGAGAAVGAYFGMPGLGASLGSAIGGIGESLWGGQQGEHSQEEVDNYQDSLNNASEILNEYGIEDFMPDLEVDDDTSFWDRLWGGTDIEIENVKEVEDALEKFEEVAVELGKVFQDVSKGLKSSFSAENFNQFIEDFTKSIEKTIHDSMVRQFMQQEMTQGLMKDLTGGITSATMDGRITDDEMEQIQNRYEAVISHAEPFFDMLQELGGLEAPKLASGGVATAPTMAMIGESEPEAVVPLSKWRKMTERTGKSQQYNENNTVEIVITGNRFDDGYTTKQVGKDIVRELRKAGVS